MSRLSLILGFAPFLSAASTCDECKSLQRCDDWKPGWPGKEIDSVACGACISQASCLGSQSPVDWCASDWAAAHCALTCCSKGYEPGPTGAPILRFLHEEAGPVLDSRVTPGTEDNMFGFEGGQLIKENATYWYFTAELFGLPVDANMRIALWRSPDITGPWQRVSTIQQSNQSYPQVLFKQQCNQPYCKWLNASADRFRMEIEYVCDPSDLLGSPWAPFPIFDESDDRWHVLYVGYMCDGTWMVSAGGGNIFGARSATRGRGGISGPYETYGIVIGPNATDPLKRWGNISHYSPQYVDQIAPYRLRNGSYAAFVAEDHYIAIADSPAGPWSVSSLQKAAITTPSSTYNENPVVTTFLRPDGSSVYVAVFDTVNSEAMGFGMSWSEDGIQWHDGVDVPMEGTIGCRTPLGLIDEGDGTATLFFTRRFSDCTNQTVLPVNGADAISPASCANVYAATFSLGWSSVAGGNTEISSDEARRKVAAHKAWERRYRALQQRLAGLDSERRAVQDLIDGLQAPSGNLLHVI